jgi:hypothetical protein
MRFFGRKKKSTLTRPEEITASWLKEKNACPSQVHLFQKTFGNRARLTRGNLLRAVQVGLDVWWLGWALGFMEEMVQEERVRAVLHERHRVYVDTYERYDDENERRRVKAAQDCRITFVIVIADRLGLPETSP